VAIALGLSLLAALEAPLTPLFDPDEGYYPATAAETLRSGSFWDLQFNGQSRWDKPLLSYALIEASFALLGESVTAARIPSAVAGGTLILSIGLIVGRLAGRRAGLLSALVVGTTLGFSIFSRVAHPEILVVFSVVTTELSLCRWLVAGGKRERLGSALCAGASLGIGLLAKGPVAAVLPLLVLFCLLPAVRFPKRRWRALARSAAVCTAIAAAVAVPWYVVMTLRHGTVFLQQAVWQQNVGRYAGAVYPHRTSAMSLVAASLIGLLPWLGLLPHALRRLQLRATAPRDVLRTTMAASAVIALAFYSLSSSKLPSYAFVAVPPMAILVGLWLDDTLDCPAAGMGWLVPAATLGVVAATIISAPWWIDQALSMRQLFGGNRPQDTAIGALMMPLSIPLGGLLVVAAGTVGAARSPTVGTLTLAGVGVLAPTLVLVTAGPLLRDMFPWEVLAREIEPGDGPLWLVGRRAPSMTFYARRPVLVASDRAALTREVRAGHAAWFAVTRGDWATIVASEPDIIARSSVRATHGRMVLVRVTSPPGSANPGSFMPRSSWVPDP